MQNKNIFDDLPECSQKDSIKTVYNLYLKHFSMRKNINDNYYTFNYKHHIKSVFVVDKGPSIRYVITFKAYASKYTVDITAYWTPLLFLGRIRYKRFKTIEQLCSYLKSFLNKKFKHN